MRISLAQDFQLKNGHISKTVNFFEKIAEKHFLPFLAYMGPFSVIFWVLQVSHSVKFLPKYAPGNGKEWGKKENLHVHKR